MSARRRTSGTVPGRVSRFVLVLTMLASCDPDTVVQVGPDDVVSVRITPDSASVGIAHTLQLRALPVDRTGALLPSLPVEWASMDLAVATVDASGLATGITTGTTEVVATVSGLTATARLEVAEAGEIVLSETSVDFAYTVGGPDPPPASVEVTNGGVLPLVELAVDSIVYGPDADDWLAAGLSGEEAPATLTLTPSPSDLTTAGSYTATVWISAEGADNSPASVVATLEITEGAASSTVGG